MAENIKKTDFVWKGKSVSGQAASGEITAISRSMAEAELRRRGFAPDKIKKKSKPLFNSTQSIKSKDITSFTAQMATMIKAGLPINNALEILKDSTAHTGIKYLCQKLRTDIEEGSMLNQAMSKHPKHFDPLYISLIAAGENSGTLVNSLERASMYREKSEAVRKKVKKAMTYPVIVLIVASLITVVMLIKVIPSFQGMFASMGSDLPAATQMVVDISKFMQANGTNILGLLVVSIIAFVFLRRSSESFNYSLDSLILKLPKFKDLVQKTASARFSRTLSTMFDAGMPIVSTMDTVAESTGNRVYKKAVNKMKTQIETGVPLNKAMRDTKLFPPLLEQMTVIGEESGNLSGTLDNVASIYEEEIDDTVDGITAMIEPLIMVFLAVVVGGMVMAMYLPVFQMGGDV